jgi:peptide/nickel transport system substrate-binding protein
MHSQPGGLTRILTWTVALAALASACAPAAPAAPTAAPKPPEAPAAKSAEAKPAAATAPAKAEAKPAASPAAKAEAKPAAQPAGPAEWVVAITEETTSVEAGTADSANGTILALRHIYEPLAAYEGAPFQLAPRLAESWTVKDNSIWDFKLRQGVKHHDGTPLTAEDVKYSLDIYRQEKSPRKANTVDIKDVEIVDPQTVRITTDGPRPGLMANLSLLLIFPKQARERMGVEEFGKKPVGTGPYKFVEFVRGQRLVLEANPDYYRGRVQPNRLVLRPIADPATRVAELKTGGVQIIQAPALAQVKELQQDPNTEMKLLKGGRIIIYPFNTTKPPFDDPRVRKAVNHAVDREGILKNVLEGYGELLHGPFASAWLGYDPELKLYPYDPALAKRLLAEAGHPNGFETTFSISSGAFLKDRDIAEVVASQLGEVGIKVRLAPTERAKLQSDWLAGTFEGMTSVAWGTAADPDAMLGWALYDRKGHKPDPQLNSLIDRSRNTVDPDQRRRVLLDMGRYVHEQALWLFIHAQDEFFAKRKDVPWEPRPEGQSFANVMYYNVASR